MAQAFVNSKIQPGKVVVFIKPNCPYCRKTQELLSQLPFNKGFWNLSVLQLPVTPVRFKITCSSSPEPERYLRSSLVKSA
uniref:Glutaredoxin-1 n=1 Tax=Bos mutus grunniens TaxID=30521 RepID=A0A8B9XI86_BOSMU